jgi:hypothetical protein
MIHSDDYILIDYKKLAKTLAEEQFLEAYEMNLRMDELYEQVDDSGNWYLKSPYDVILDCMQADWESRLLELDITNSVL